MNFAGVSASGLQALIPGTYHCNVSVLLTRPAAWLCPLQENVELLACGRFSSVIRSLGQQQRYSERNAWWESVVYKYYLTYTSNLNWNWCNQTNDRGKSWRFDSMQVSWTQSDNEIHLKWRHRWVPASHNCGKAQNSNTGKAMLSPASSTLFGSQR